MKTLELLKQLIAFPTVSKDSNLDLIEFIEDYLRKLEIPSTRVPNGKGTKANLYATVGPMEKEGVIL